MSHVSPWPFSPGPKPGSQRSETEEGAEGGLLGRASVPAAASFHPSSLHYPHRSHPLSLPEALPSALKHCIRAPPTGHIHFTAATDFTALLSAECCFDKLMGTIQQHVTRIWTKWVFKKNVQNPNPTSIFISQTEPSDVVLLFETRWSQLVL